MTRPLTYEKHRYNIYSQDVQESINILAFIEEEAKTPKISLITEEADINSYVLDFKEQEECHCYCHKTKQTQDNNLLIRSLSSGKIPMNIEFDRPIEKEEFKPRSSAKKLTSISLKEYKQHIRKKFLEKSQQKK